VHSLNDTYRFYYNSPLTGQTQCYPANDAIDFVWEKTDNFYRRKINTPLRFIKNDFTNLHQLERSDDRCEKIDFTVEIKCGESFFPYWSGFLALVNGNFNVSKCFVDITPRLEDDYTCFLKVWEKEYNIIDIVPRVNNIKITDFANIETYICYGLELSTSDVNTWGNNCLPDLSPPTGSWGIVFQNSVPSTEPGYVFVTTIFARDTAFFASDPGAPWEYIGPGPGGTSRYGRPIARGELIIDETGVITNVISRGYPVMEVIQRIIDECGLTLVSDFYSFNPPGNAPSNFAYDYAAAYYNNLLFFQITDVKEPNADEAATIANSKLKEILDNLKFHHNIGWTIDNAELRIEHISYFSQARLMLDLTQPATVEYIAGKHEYKYITEEMPRSEKWSFPTKSLDIDWDAPSVTYQDTCSYDEDGKDVEYKIGKWASNILHIINNKDKYSDDLFVLVANNPVNNTIYRMAGEITGVMKINGTMALSNTIYYLQRHRRPQSRGVMNNQPEQFYNVQKKRAQPEISIPICCEDLLQFNPNDYVKSQLGWGEVASAKYNTKTKLLSLELNFD
jgi:hypothetical protein